VVRWWGGPEEQYALVSGDLDHPDMDQFIVGVGGRPFAYLQCYALAAWNQGFGSQPPGTRGIDQFIGEPDMIGRGHGSHFIRQFVDALLRSGTPRVVTDPDPANARAVRAYEKAGFERDRLVDTPDGRALLMVRNGCDLS
jgi:aminoglycoside 6'-N-acetyltransferase